MDAAGPTSPTLGQAHRELWQAVRDEITKLVISGEFLPGERLLGAALAERFDVSRGTVQTALAELERAGLVHSTPRRGVQVATFERKDIDELMDATLALERAAVRWTAERASEAEIARLKELLSALDRAEHGSDRPATVAAELEFHRELMRACGNRRLLQLWTQLSEQIRFVISVVQRALPHFEWALYEKPVLDAIEARDPKTAEAELVRCFEVAHAELNALSQEAFDALTGRARTAEVR